MSNASKIGMAVMGGYVLGRTKKAKLAIMLGGALAGRKLRLSPGELLSQGSKLVASSPELTRLSDAVRGRLLDAGKQAAVAAANNRLESLTDSLVERVENIGKPVEQVAGAAGDAAGAGVEQAGDTAGAAVEGAGAAAESATGAAGDAVESAGGPVGGAAGTATRKTGKAVGSTTRTAGRAASGATSRSRTSSDTDGGDDGQAPVRRRTTSSRDSDPAGGSGPTGDGSGTRSSGSGRRSGTGAGAKSSGTGRSGTSSKASSSTGTSRKSSSSTSSGRRSSSSSGGRTARRGSSGRSEA